MKREIRFRAKVVKHDPMTNPDNGWVGGFYFQDLSNGEIKHYIHNCPMTWEVDPTTIGQFTGLTDKNGTEIYEGDIICTHLNVVVVKWGYKEHIVKHHRIVDSIAAYGWIVESVANGLTDFLDNEFLQGEVIGNIYDNPELVK